MLFYCNRWYFNDDEILIQQIKRPYKYIVHLYIRTYSINVIIVLKINRKSYKWIRDANFPSPHTLDVTEKWNRSFNLQLYNMFINFKTILGHKCARSQSSGAVNWQRERVSRSTGPPLTGPRSALCKQQICGSLTAALLYLPNTDYKMSLSPNYSMQINNNARSLWRPYSRICPNNLPKSPNWKALADFQEKVKAITSPHRFLLPRS